MEYISLIVSICALAISAISFIRYDRKIKKQNWLINQYQIQQIEEKKCAQNSAKISGSIIKGKMGMRTLVITNTGLAPARNINITDIRNIKGIIQTGGLCFPYMLLNPREQIEVTFLLAECAPSVINMKYSWDDDHKTGNIYQQSLQL